jgi:hypothetical protein
MPRIPEPGEVVEKLEVLIRQNQEIIQLLTLLAKPPEKHPGETEFRGSKRR